MTVFQIGGTPLANYFDKNRLLRLVSYSQPIISMHHKVTRLFRRLCVKAKYMSLNHFRKKIIIARKQSLGQGNVFTGVYPPRGSAKGSVYRGGSASRGLGRNPPTRTTKAGGANPTEMFSCFLSVPN